MKLNLTKNLVFFDLETTGLNIMKDRIVQIALIKYNVGGEEGEELSMLINPGIPISQEAMDVHKITPEMVRNKPLFSQVAQEIYDFIGDADLAGYNSNRFDVPLLMEEFNRCGLSFDIEKRKLLDIQQIFYKMEPRTLSAAYKFYCNKKMTGAHDALMDVRATVDILKGQISKYDGVVYEDQDGNITENPIRNDVEALCRFTKNPNEVDITQRLKKNKNGEIVFNFGKHIKQPVIEVLARDPQYFKWLLEKDFSVQMKAIIKKIMNTNAKN